MLKCSLLHHPIMASEPIKPMEPAQTLGVTSWDNKVEICIRAVFNKEASGSSCWEMMQQFYTFLGGILHLCVTPSCPLQCPEVSSPSQGMKSKAEPQSPGAVPEALGFTKQSPRALGLYLWPWDSPLQQSQVLRDLHTQLTCRASPLGSGISTKPSHSQRCGSPSQCQAQHCLQPCTHRDASVQ